MTHDQQQPMEMKWWKESVVYQIYPRSFRDSNGDGIGDLRGIIEKLDYLKDLGINVIWLSPVYKSPNDDNGYDISDYQDIMQEFGTLDDWDELRAAMHERGIKLVMDLVVNHTSDEHHWFAEARKSKDNPYRDYYIWHPGKDGRAPNNWESFFGGSAWQCDAATGEYYLHLFSKKQPDLNWENPKVRADVYEIMRFWLRRGVSGFRMDVIPFISKRDGLPDLTPDELPHPEFVYANGPRVHQYLQEMNHEVLSHYDTMTVGEAFGVTFEQASLFTDARRDELNMIFHFDLVRLDRDGWRKKDWTLPELKATYTKIDQTPGRHGWNTSFLTNHDNPRAVSHFGDDTPEWRAISAKALATMMLTQRATPFLYQGDELGMTNYPFLGVEDYNDVEVKGQWRDLVETEKVTADEYLAHLRQTSRDNSRTPMQWTAEPYGGFTSGKPWLAVNPNYLEINAASQIDDPQSIYNHHRRLIALRNQTPALVYGEYRDIDPGHAAVFAYTRTLGDERYLVLINFARQKISYDLPNRLAVTSIVLDSGPGEQIEPGSRNVLLNPWQATIFTL